MRISVAQMAVAIRSWVAWQILAGKWSGW